MFHLRQEKSEIISSTSVVNFPSSRFKWGLTGNSATHSYFFSKVRPNKSSVLSGTTVIFACYLFRAVRRYTAAILVDPTYIRAYICRAEAYHKLHMVSTQIHQSSVGMIFIKKPEPCFASYQCQFCSHGTGRIFDWLKNVTRHFIHMGQFNIFPLFTQN